MIPSLSFDQNEILKNILTLLEIEKFDADFTYGNGGFYKEIPEPDYKFDIDPQDDETMRACSRKLPLNDSHIRSAVFDPPFLTYVREARNHNSVMAGRFGGYWTYAELEHHYITTLEEAYRVIQPKGFLVFKCQDVIHNHKMHSTHINVVNWAEGMFRLKDLFILGAKHRMPMPSKEGENPRKQKHARVFHSYFLVLERGAK